MAKLFRLASPNDYEFNSELGLWELSFDKRPVAGTRYEDPHQGAKIYNEKRKKFFMAWREGKKEWDEMSHQAISFKEVIAWAASSEADNKQCWFMERLFMVKNESEYTDIALEFMKDDESPLPLRYELAMYFMGFTQRLSTDLEQISAIKSKSAAWKKQSRV